MSTHNIEFYEENKQNYQQISAIMHLISSSVHVYRKDPKFSDR